MPPHPPPLRLPLALFVAAKLAVNTATRFVYAFLPAIARGLGVSTAAAGRLTSLRWAAGAMTPIVVRVAGGEHRRRIVLTGLGMFVAGAAVTAATGTYAGAVAGFALMGVAKPVFDSGSQAWVSDRVAYGRRGRVVGLLETTWALSFLVGAPAAGWLIERGGWVAPFWAVAFAVAILAGGIAVAVGGSTAADVAKGDGVIVWDRASTGFLAGSALLVGSVEMVFVTVAVWLEETHGFTVAGLAVVATVIGVAELIAEGATVAFTDRIGKLVAVAAGIAVSATGFVLVAVLQTATVPAVAALVAGIAGFEFAFVSSIPLGTELQPAVRIGFLARFVVAQTAGRAAASLIAIAVLGAFGMGAVAMLAGLVAAAAGLVTVGSVRNHQVVGRP